MQIHTNIVITGASSGLGAALARAYAQPGRVLGLIGRNQERLNAVAADCIAKGAAVECGIVDVRDEPGMQQWLESFDASHPISLLIANAGIAVGMTESGETSEQVRAVFATNLGGVLSSVLPIIPRMQTRKTGQIAIISSLAGIRGIPGCPSYSASKMAVRGWGEALRGMLKADGIQVSVVCPGYVRTPMTDVNTFPMPFIMSAEKAAGIILRGLAANRPRIAFPLAFYLPLWLLTCLPLRLTDAFFAALPKKTVKEKG